MLPGAVMEAEAPDAGVAAHYGSPAREGRAWDAGTALVDLSHLEVVTVGGVERLGWLHRFTSQHVAALAPGVSAESLILDPLGRVEHAFALVDDGETAWLVTEAGRADGLVAFLDSMRFAARVEVARATGVAVLAHRGAAPSGLVDSLGARLTWADPWPVTSGTRYAMPDGEHPAFGWDLRLAVAPDAAAAAGAWTGAGGSLAGVWTLEAARIAAWRPRLATEVDARTIPHELDWLRTAVHLRKGCYRGQETVARVVNLGKPPRRLVFLHLDGSAEDLPAPGTPLLLGERQVGRVTSVARHHELGPIGLGVVKRSADEHADLVAATGEGAGEVSAAQTPVVPAAGASTATPRQRPGAELRGGRRGAGDGAAGLL